MGELWPTSTHPHPIPPAHFPGMLVHPCHSQTPRCHPRPHPPPTWNSISTGFKISPIPRYQHPIASFSLPHPYFAFFSPSGTCEHLGDQSHRAGWKLQYFIYFHRDLSTPEMSMDSSQVGVAFFFFFLTYFLSLYIDELWFNCLAILILDHSSPPLCTRRHVEQNLNRYFLFQIYLD